MCMGVFPEEQGRPLPQLLCPGNRAGHMLLIKSLEPWPGAGVSHTQSPVPDSRGACPTRK